MDTLWRLFSYYMPTIRDDGRDYELPIYGSTSNSSRPRARGQRHDRPRSVPHVRDIQARWKKEDEAEMEDLQAMTRTARPQPVLEKEAEETRKRRRSVVETDDPSPAKPPPSPAETDKANETEKTVASRAVTSLSPPEASSKHSSSHVQRHERRKSGKLRDDGTSRSGEFQSSSSSARIVTLQRELQQLQADLSSTKFELEHQRSVNIHLLAQKNRVESELAQVTGTRNAQAAELLALRAALADRALAERPPDMRDEELATLKSFLTKTDNYSGAQILQFVHDLNTEIVQLAAAVSEEFPLSRREPSAWTPAQEDLIRSALGEGMLGMLRDSEHDEDPCLVQLAVQAWEVRCCQDILDAFCTGVAPEVDRFLRNLFEEMQAAEPQATTSRWRALTHLHARNMVARLDSVSPEAPPPSSASAASSCISPIALHRPQAAYPTPESSNNSTPASQIFALPSMSLALAAPAAPVARTNIDGLRAILALAGCTDERGTSPGPLAERFGDAVARIGEAAEALARAVREGVSSAWFAVRVTPPAHSFDAADMENTYAGYGDETADVLCTVGLGLEVVKRVEPTPDRDQNAALQRTLLLKPKVILASVQELL